MTDDTHTLIVYTANLAASALSLFGSLAIIINYIYYANKSQLLYKLIFFLSVADLGGSLSICVSQTFLLVDEATYGIVECKIFRAAINFFYVSSFCWTSSICLHIFLCSRQQAQIPIVWFHVFSWGIPAITTTILITGNMIEPEEFSHWCHLTPMAKWLLWFAPLLTSFAWNLVLYSLVLARYSSTKSSSYISQNKRQRHLQWKTKKRLTLYLLAFTVCWVWDVSDTIAGHFYSSNSLYWLWLLQSFFSPLQGFLNFLVYGVSSRMFREHSNKHGSEHKRFLTVQ